MKRILSVAAVGGLCFLIMACAAAGAGSGSSGTGQSHGSGESEITLPTAGVTFDATQLGLLYYGADELDQGYNTDVFFLGGDLAIDHYFDDEYWTTAGGRVDELSMLVLWLNDDEPGIAIEPGEYKVVASDNPDGDEGPGKIVSVELAAGVSIDFDEMAVSWDYAAMTPPCEDGADEITRGRVDVEKNQGEYTFDFSFDLADGNTITGWYRGAVDYTYDYEETTAPAGPFYVTYHENDADGGRPPLDGNEYDTGDMVRVAENSRGLYRSEYTFAGWNTEPDASGVDYAPGSTFRMPSNDVDLYARWAGTAVRIDFRNPESPTITLEGSGTIGKGDVLSITASAGYGGYTWYLNGSPTATGLSSSDNHALVDTTHLRYGSHTLSVVLDEGYSSQFTFDVVSD